LLQRRDSRTKGASGSLTTIAQAGVPENISVARMARLAIILPGRIAGRASHFVDWLA
jgi:hypothetical protein